MATMLWHEVASSRTPIGLTHTTGASHFLHCLIVPTDELPGNKVIKLYPTIKLIYPKKVRKIWFTSEKLPIKIERRF